MVSCKDTTIIILAIISTLIYIKERSDNQH